MGEEVKLCTCSVGDLKTDCPFTTEAQVVHFQNWKIQKELGILEEARA